MPKTQAKLMRDKAWKMFSLYIKLRDANEEGTCTCCTCGTRIEFDSPDCQAGHFLTSRSNSVLLDERIVHAQCERCNMWHGGAQGAYLLFMKDKYGLTDDQLRDMLINRREVVKFKESDFRDKVIAYWVIIRGLLATKFIASSDVHNRVIDKVKTFHVKAILEGK